MDSLPPHFHKQDRISELDLIPDSTIYADLPVTAEEGRFAVKKNGSTYELYKWLDGAWRLINSVPVSPGWTLASYAASSGTPDITISGLDLAADLNYQIVVDCKNNAVATGKMTAQANSDATAGRHRWILQKAYFYSTGSPSGAVDGSLSDTKWDLTESMCSHQCSMILGYNGGIPLATWMATALGTTTDIANAIAAIQGSGFWNSGTNITSIKFAHVGGNSDWVAWLFKAATS